MQKVAKTKRKKVQKVAKILTIFFFMLILLIVEEKMKRLFENKLFRWKETGMKKPLMVIRSKTNRKNIYNR